MRAALVLVGLLLAAPLGVPAAAAPSLPALFSVIGVGAGDKLNVRAAPDPKAEIVGALAPDAEGIEVVGLDPTGEWGRVNVGEGAGWVALRFLVAGPDAWAADALPEGLRCFGTEPFWSLRPEGRTLRYASPDGADKVLDLKAVLEVPGAASRALVARGRMAGITAFVTPRDCSDGMSDRAFALGVDAVLEGEGAPRLLTGCCSIAP